MTKKMEWIKVFDVLPIDGKSCVVTDGEHIGYIIFNESPMFYGDFNSANITHYMYPDLPIEIKGEKP